MNILSAGRVVRRLSPFLLLVIVGCQGLPERVDQIQDEGDVTAFLDQLGKRYESACVKLGQATWNSMLSNEGMEDVDSARAELGDIFLNPVYRDIVNLWRFGKRNVKDPELQRKLVLWNRCYMGAALQFDEDLLQLENAVQKMDDEFQFRLEGSETTRSELNRIIRTDPDPEKRRLAWEAFGELSKTLEGGMRDVLRARNEKAIFLGNQIDYGYYTLFAQGIEEEWLLGIIDQLEAKTREPYLRFLAFLKQTMNVKKMYPWDLAYAIRRVEPVADEYFPADKAMPTLLDCLGSLGFAADKLPFEIRQGDIGYGILDIAVQIPSDVRLIVSSNGGYGFYSGLMAECGRCLYVSHIRANDPIYKGYDWVMGASSSAYLGGMAEVLADFTKESRWFQKFTTLPEREVEAFRNARLALDLYSIRALMSSIVFELQAYKNPDQDLDKLHKDLDRLFLMIDVPEEVGPRWASMISLINEPVYNQNYFLAALIAAQVHQALKAQFGDRYMENPEVGGWLIEKLYAAGESVPWRDRVRLATDKDLEVNAYVQRFLDKSPQ